MKKTAFILALMVSFTAFSQKYSYAVIQVEQRTLGSKFNVKVDLGDTREQKRQAEEYAEDLHKTGSQAAILNYMGERGYSFVQVKNISLSNERDMVIIMRKEE